MRVLVATAVVQGLARGDAWNARFPGDVTYCSSSDRAPFSTLRTP